MEMSVSRRSFIPGAATVVAAGLAMNTMGGSVAKADEVSSETVAIPDWLGEEPEDGQIINVIETEILIIGAGNGGLVAAASASDFGLDYLLAEAYDGVQNTRYWIGAINSTHTKEAGVEVDTEREQYEVARYASFKCNQRLQKMWINESAEMIDWLDSIMEPAGFIAEVDTALGDEMDVTNRTGSYVPPQQHMYITNGSTWTQSWSAADRNSLLLAHIENAGDTDKILWEHTLVKLVHTDNKVTGAIFETDEGNVQVNAHCIILATGGYPGNSDMVKAIAPAAVNCVTLAGYSPKDRGVGIKAGIWAGGMKDIECAPMIFNRGLVEPGVDCGYDENNRFPGSVNMTLGSQPFMKVSREGRRFCNESCPYDFNCFAAAQHEGGVWAQIFDANAVEDVTRFNTAGCTKMATAYLIEGQTIEEHLANYLESGLFFKADSIEKLADMLGFVGEAKDNFLKEIDRYNGFYDAQEDADFGKEAYRLSAIRTAPFYGAWYGGSLLTTCDGLRINEDCQVINADTKPIEGLYAVGDCSGSFFSGNYPEYLVGVALGRTLTEARHVIRKLAGDL